jgi:transcriptional regulator with XRE-family HTH domain
MAAGFEKQSALADKVKVSQQAVSRWEAGLSRPKSKQIPALATALKLDEAKLREAAGYGAPAETLPGMVTVSFDQDFPVDALSPESFERFVEQVVRLRYPDATEVRRAGTTGHDQAGIDVLAILVDGRRLTIQCKRVNRFGPADVDSAVARQTEPADEKILALSRVASPKTAGALRKHPGWMLWDKQDLSRFVRAFEKPEQIRLIDTFFPGQRMALLGEPTSGPWQRPDDFFAPFATKFAAFRHDWPLIGRRSDVPILLDKLLSAKNRIVLMAGRGGVGKSRLLKEVVAMLAVRAPRLNVFFLSPTEPLTSASLEALGASPKLLVVDDAHDRADLAPLFVYAANSARDVRVLIATRPYAIARLRAQAGVFALAGAIDAIEIRPLSRTDTQALAAAVLNTYGGSSSLAEPIAKATGDCPLVTVMAARIAATDKMPPLLAQDTQNFRDTILGKFAKVITGELAGPGDQKAIADVMQAIALVQPFSIDDAEFGALVTSVTGLEDHVVSVTLRLLADGGVIFRRGTQYRLMPDLLGDYIIEQTCIGVGDRLNPLADRIFALAPRPLLGNVLVNLGRLDWRKNGGDSSKSYLLDHLWRALKVTSDYHDSALEAAASAAFYNPRQALEFVERQVDAGSRRDELCRILRHAAYHLEFVTPACELLWEIGRLDNRELNRYPNHAIRTLNELCTVEPDKPIGFNGKVVEFGLSLVSHLGSLENAFTPFDFLKGILSGAGYTTTGDSRTITMSGFAVNYDAVANLRAKVIDAAFTILTGTSIRASCLAASFLGNALRYPMAALDMRIPDETRDRYTAEFLLTLERLHILVARGTLEPVVVIAVSRAISWHANYAGGSTAVAAKAILDDLPRSLEFRTLCALADGWGQIFLGGMDGNTWQARVNQWIGDLAADLDRAYPAVADLRSFLETCLTRVIESSLSKSSPAHVLIHEILRIRTELAPHIIETSLINRGGPLISYLGAALFFVLKINPKLGGLWACRLLDTGDVRFEEAVAQAYNDPPLNGGTLAPVDYEVLLRVLGSSSLNVVLCATGVMHRFGAENPRLALDLLRHINFNADVRVMDHVFMALHADQSRLFAAMTDGDVDYLFSQLKPIAELDGYWVETLLAHLSLHFPERTCRFFMERVELTAKDENFSAMRPINYGPWVHVPLRFREVQCFRLLLDLVWGWIVARDAGDWRFEHNAAALFDAVFLPFDEVILSFLSAKLITAGKQDLRWIASVVSHADPSFVFEHVDFVLGFLEGCDRAGRPARRMGVQGLFRASISGVRSVRPGQPFQRDVDNAQRAREILPRLPRLSGAYELYSAILSEAERGIAQAHQEAEFFDDD